MRKLFILPLIATFVFVCMPIYGASADDNNGFILTDASAYSKVINTKYVRDLTMKYPNVFVLQEGVAPKYRLFYLGFDEGSHTTRYDSLKVDMQGIVYRNADKTLAEEIWVVVE